MKRIFCTLILVALVFIQTSALSQQALYEEEILFRNIEWHCDMNTVVAKITEEIPGYYKIKPDARIIHDSNWYTCHIASSNDAGYSFELTPHEDFYVGGHSVSKIKAYALYSISDDALIKDIDSSRFVMAEYDFIVNNLNVANVYDDLYSKMCEIYGQPYDTSDAIDMLAVWHGDNETGVYLAGSRNFLHLCYGKIDSYEDISEILTIRNNELVSDPSSTDGL